MNEYPKALYKGADVDACLADSITVLDVGQEAAARKDGYAMYAEIHAKQHAAPNTKSSEEVPAKRVYNRKAK